MVGDKCHGCGLWGGRMMDEKEEGEGPTQGSRAGLRLAFCRTRPRKGQQGVVTLESEAQGLEP